MYLDTCTQRAFQTVPLWLQNALCGIERINLYKIMGRKFFRENDFGFEQVITTYLASYFIPHIPANYELGIGETLQNTTMRIKVQPDFSLVNNSGNVLEVMEVKTILNNNFNWLKKDVQKLRSLTQVQNKYILSVNLYVSQRTFRQRTNYSNATANKYRITLLSQGTIFTTPKGNIFYYFLYRL